MMKKVISAVLAFTLVCGTAVSAAGNQNEQTDTLTDITQEEQAVTADVSSSEESSESTESVADDTFSDEQASETAVPSEESADADEAKTAGMYFGRSGRYTDGKDIWLFEEKGDSITLTGYEGTSRAPKIPDEINGKKVTAIGEDVFQINDTIVKISIPANITSIGESAFSHCRLLQYVTMTDNVTYLGGYTFANCPRLTYIRLSNNIQILYEGTLCYTAVSSITLPKKLGIMEGVLIDSRVETVNLPDTLQYIQEGRYLGSNADMKIAGAGGPGQGAAFWICNDLKRVVIPEGLVFIHYVAFKTIPLEGEQSIKNVYYKGTKEQWKKIKRSNDDYEHEDNLAAAKKHYNYKNSKTSLAFAEVKIDYYSQDYDGKAKKPREVVWLYGKRLVKNRDYTVKYVNNVNVGTAKMVITGKGKYTGKISPKFNIYPKKSTITKTAADTNSIAVYFKKDTQADGYYLEYSKKPFSKNSDSSFKSIKKGNNGKKTITGLQPDTTYYIRMYAWKEHKSDLPGIGYGGYEGAYSKVIKVKTKALPISK